MSLSLRERLEGGLWGLLVGDALGTPYEFCPRDQMPPPEKIEMTPPVGFEPTYKVPPGTYSDDGAQALCLLASLLKCGALDLDDFGHKLVDWSSKGYLAADQHAFDCGVQTEQAIRVMKNGTPARQAGRRDEQANGNGSLMRVLPLALWHAGTDRDLVACAHDQSLVTHGHPRAQACCALYCLWARRILEGGHDAPWRHALASLREIYAHDPLRLHELDQHLRFDDLNYHEASCVQGSGYVVDCLRSALWSIEQGPYEHAFQAAVGLGKDTDTMACVAGGIAGLRDGVGAIPERWRRSLRGKELVTPLLDKLLDHREIVGF